jgi:D-3-phosphoglycerate dehydrogenase
MNQSEIQFFIIDFDSTFIKTEGLEELAELVLAKNPRREKIMEDIREITRQGMAGEIDFTSSLEKRLDLFAPKKEHIARLVKILKRKITPSFKRNKTFFKTYADRIYIISGGFSEWVEPVVADFGIPAGHVLANRFTLDHHGNVTGFDRKNLLAQKDGKARQIKKLGLKGAIHVIGDGYTDYQIKAHGLAQTFYVFTENVHRPEIAARADHILPNFDEFLYLLHMPRALSLPKNRIKVLLLENIDQVAVQAFAAEGYSIECLTQALGEDELAEKIKEVSILGIRSKSKITASVLANAPRLLAIGAYCIGTNQIDLPACAAKGVAVFNAPYSNTRSVAELALGEIILLNRMVFDKARHMHQSVWEKSAKSSHEVRGKTLGIIGYGNIGTQLSVLAESLGIKVYFYDIEEKLPLGNAVKCSGLKDLLTKSDFISVHVDGRKQNHHLIGEKEFRLMKEGAIFLNLSRGFVVDIAALAKNIKQGKLRGAGIDVFPQEPKSNAEPFESELQNMPNTLLTPHIGGSTEEAQENIGRYVSRKSIDFINNGDTTLSVNLPEVTLPKAPANHRLVHIHKNVSGVLAQINGILARHKINIEEQSLRTNEEIGYVITDIPCEYNHEVIEELKKIPATIKLRVLF